MALHGAGGVGLPAHAQKERPRHQAGIGGQALQVQGAGLIQNRAMQGIGQTFAAPVRGDEGQIKQTIAAQRHKAFGGRIAGDNGDQAGQPIGPKRGIGPRRGPGGPFDGRVFRRGPDVDRVEGDLRQSIVIVGLDLGSGMPTR